MIILKYAYKFIEIMFVLGQKNINPNIKQFKKSF